MMNRINKYNKNQTEWKGHNTQDLQNNLMIKSKCKNRKKNKKMLKTKIKILVNFKYKVLK